MFCCGPCRLAQALLPWRSLYADVGRVDRMRDEDVCLRARGGGSGVPTGRSFRLPRYPALKRRAIVRGPSGTSPCQTFDCMEFVVIAASSLMCSIV